MLLIHGQRLVKSFPTKTDPLVYFLDEGEGTKSWTLTCEWLTVSRSRVGWEKDTQRSVAQETGTGSTSTVKLEKL